MDSGNGEEGPRCGFFTDSMDHPCQQRVSEPGDLCHLHPPEDLAEQPRCGWEKADGDFCRAKVGQDEPGSHCYQHPPEEADIPDSRGAPEGNDFAAGNPGGGPPEGNVNAMKHGLHMTAERLMETMDAGQREEFKHRFLEFQDKCMNDSRAMLLAARAVMEVSLTAEIFEGIAEEGFTRTAYSDAGDPYEQFKGDDLQALNALGREIRLGLHYEGNSAQHRGGGSSGHDNADQLVESD